MIRQLQAKKSFIIGLHFVHTEIAEKILDLKSNYLYISEI